MISSTMAVIIACHNRRETTLECLDHLAKNELKAFRSEIFLMDDGSTDGTSEAVRAKYPQVNILSGNGNLFWNQGMYQAFSKAIEKGFDYYLWLNDDTNLYPHAVSTLIDSHRKLAKRTSSRSIVIGSACDPATNSLTYGGYKLRRPGKKLSFNMVVPQDDLVECDTMCGNCVLIPSEVVELVGNTDPVFRHRWGDMDYGLRAKRANCKVYVAPGYAGTCEDNPLAKSWRDFKIPIRDRINILHSVKGLHKEDWKTYVKRHGGS
ncbi:MAG: glycosyltransferase family 2 protein, partial [Saprospiraceae bacterium]|nr:glycosyltransferase family 2 protein [Saprospiraceae bacterium]